MSSKLKVTRSRSFSAHHMLIGAARAAVEDAEAKRPGWFYSQLTAITLCGLAIEAICNAIGKRIIPDWKDFESAGPNAKLRLLCDRLNVKYDRHAEPWSSARWLSKQRNAIAHAKPQVIEEEHIWTRDEYDRQRTDSPTSDLEREITLGNANRALRTAKDILLQLCQAIPVEYRLGLFSDAWEGSASAIRDD
ncbi:MAG: hypothetical protein AMJ67_12515 [Betaproteobacteria bacterium SG8_41]|nr:MAG: hypothetical protein AMJ67_12515 [Betaproteobacteria bacterium SG8_41]